MGEQCCPEGLRKEVCRELADDLLEMHEATGISLDGWVAGREFVEAFHGPIQENEAHERD